MSGTSVFSDTFASMGTRCDVVLPGIEMEFGEQIFQIIKTECIRLEHLLSRFIKDSPVSELNRAEKNIWLSVDDELWDIITICYDFYQMSNGAFDVTVAPIISLWKKESKPSTKEIEQARAISGFDKVEFNFEQKKLMFTVNNLEFDFGAIGKGIALDTVKNVLQKQGVKNAIVSFGESSILALGTHPNGDYWPLGIANQLQKDEYIHVFKTTNETVTNSGTIYTTDEGKVKNRKHIISPETGMPVDSNKTVSVKSESATLGEFISTVWLILPENDKNILSDALKNIEIVEAEYLQNEVKTKHTILQ